MKERTQYANCQHYLQPKRKLPLRDATGLKWFKKRFPAARQEVCRPVRAFSHFFAVQST